MSDIDLRRAALDYHEADPAGQNRHPGHQAGCQPARPGAGLFAGRRACLHGDRRQPGATSPRYTARGNLVAVITNGTAVLGLGDIGPLAAKPVMEGKAVLFKKFAGIDVFDIEVAEKEPDRFVEAVARARAHLRRHQPRGHQGAGVLRDRAPPCASA